MKVKIDEITVGERLREDMGNVQELADSIAKYGLLHPIIIDDHKRLVAGGRRLAACKLLGHIMIEATDKGELSDKVLREIELEENLKRKDLTEIEKSRDLVELVELKTEILKTMTPRVTVSGSRGPDKKADSLKTIAEELKIPRQTLHDAKQHVQAVDTYPELEELPKKEAIQAAKELSVMSEEERKPALQVVKEKKLSIQTQLKNDAQYQLAKMNREFSTLVASFERRGNIERLVEETSYQELQEFLADLNYIYKTISQWQSVINEHLRKNKEIRRVK
jgi:hypothetical protein